MDRIARARFECSGRRHPCHAPTSVDFLRLTGVGPYSGHRIGRLWYFMDGRACACALRSLRVSYGFSPGFSRNSAGRQSAARRNFKGTYSRQRPAPRRQHGREPLESGVRDAGALRCAREACQRAPVYTGDTLVSTLDHSLPRAYPDCW